MTEMPEDGTARRGASLAERWGRPVSGLGFTGVPNLLISSQRALGISPPEMSVLLHVLQRWWFVDRLPYPSIGTLERGLPMKRRAIQRAITGLAAKGLVARLPKDPKDGPAAGGKLDLSGLRSRLVELAAAVDEDRRRKRARGSNSERPREA